MVVVKLPLWELERSRIVGDLAVHSANFRSMVLWTLSRESVFVVSVNWRIHSGACGLQCFYFSCLRSHVQCPLYASSLIMCHPGSIASMIPEITAKCAKLLKPRVWPLIHIATKCVILPGFITRTTTTKEKEQESVGNSTAASKEQLGLKIQDMLDANTRYCLRMWRTKKQFQGVVVQQ